MNDIKALFQLVIDNIPAKVFWKDQNSRYLGANARFARVAGADSVESVIGKTDFDLAWSPSQAKAYVKDDQQVLTTGVPKLNIIEPQSRADGQVHWLETNKIPLVAPSGERVGILGFFRDITEDVNKTLELEKKALLDALTELPNRYFVEELMKSIEKGNSEYSGLLFIDLDYFKTVNDTLGHAVGDRLLQQVAFKLKETVANRGIVARLGGDEFCVVVIQLEGNTGFKENMESLSRDILYSFRQPFHVEKHILYLGASIGISLFNRGVINGSHAFREADLALYEAKSKGRNAYVFYSEQIKQRVDDEHDLLMKLRKAVDKSEFHLVYQPQFDVNEQCIGAEALMRWDQPEIGVIPPDQFIPLAEKAGLIHPMGDWLLDESRRIQHALCGADKHYRLAINISPLQFCQEGFEDLLIEKYLAADVPPSMFELEVTESLLLSQQDAVFAKLQRLREIGFSIAIDDFGTGYSSLSYLSRLPVDKLKIDKSFVMRLFEDEKNQLIVKMILQMARGLGIKTVAEGVETRAEFEFLKRHRCDYFQGYYFSRPVSEDRYCSEY